MLYLVMSPSFSGEISSGLQQNMQCYKTVKIKSSGEISRKARWGAVELRLS